MRGLCDGGLSDHAAPLISQQKRGTFEVPLFAQFICDPAGTRTQNQLIKSNLLYFQLHVLLKCNQQLVTLNQFQMPQALD